MSMWWKEIKKPNNQSQVIDTGTEYWIAMLLIQYRGVLMNSIF